MHFSHSKLDFLRQEGESRQCKTVVNAVGRRGIPVIWKDIVLVYVREGERVRGLEFAKMRYLY